MRARFFLAVCAMAAVVAASNFLVQFPVQAQLGGINLADLLTWGAFTYPVAFLVTDLTNRYFGPNGARGVVFSGFVAGVLVLLVLGYLARFADESSSALFLVMLYTPPRILLASGVAFFVAQLLDVAIFNRLRADAAWWRAPLISSFLGSAIDTILFFGVAFSARFAFIDAGFGSEDGSLAFGVPLLGVGAEVPLWVSLAVGDFIVKMLVALALLVPYRVLRGRIADRVLHPAAG